MAKNEELHILKFFFYLLVLAGNEIKKSLNKFDPCMSMVRRSRWLWQGNVFVLIFDLVQHVAPLFYSGHWHNYFLQLGQVVRASVQSIFLRCLWCDRIHRNVCYESSGCLYFVSHCIVLWIHILNAYSQHFILLVTWELAQWVRVFVTGASF